MGERDCLVSILSVPVDAWKRAAYLLGHRHSFQRGRGARQPCVGLAAILQTALRQSALSDEAWTRNAPTEVLRASRLLTWWMIGPKTRGGLTVAPSNEGFSSLMYFQNAFSAKVLDAINLCQPFLLCSACKGRSTDLGTCLHLEHLGLAPRRLGYCTRSSPSRRT